MRKIIDIYLELHFIFLLFYYYCDNTIETIFWVDIDTFFKDTKVCRIIMTSEEYMEISKWVVV